MEKEKFNTNAMVEAALMAVFVIVILIVTGYVPILSFFGTLILPIPIAVLYLRQNFNITLSCIVVSTIITALLFNPIISINAAINYALIGLALGYCIKNKKSAYFTVLMLTLACILTNILSALIMLVFIEKTSLVTFLTDSANTVINTFKASFEEARNYYVNMGVSGKQLEQMDQALNMINIENMLLMLPVSILIYGFMAAYINYIVSIKILKKLRYEVEEVLPFSKFYISNLVGAALIGVTCIGIILSGKNVYGAEYFYKSMIFIIRFIFILNGVAAAAYFMKKKRLLSKRVTTLLIFFSFIVGLGELYFIIGFVEMIFDYRRLDPYRIRKV